MHTEYQGVLCACVVGGRRCWQRGERLRRSNLPHLAGGGALPSRVLTLLKEDQDGDGDGDGVKRIREMKAARVCHEGEAIDVQVVPGYAAVGWVPAACSLASRLLEI